MINPYRILYCNRCGWQYPGNAHGLACVNKCPNCLKHGLWYMSGDVNDSEDWKRLSSKIREREESIETRTF